MYLLERFEKLQTLVKQEIYEHAIRYRGNLAERFSRNFEAFASEFLEDLE